METELRNVSDASVGDLRDGCDLVILGCPAYGDDTVELQDDFAEFYEKLDDVDLSGRKFAIFAPGDSSYEHFCGSVDLLEEKMKQLGGEVVIDGLKVDGDPSDFEDEILEWAKSASSLANSFSRE